MYKCDNDVVDHQVVNMRYQSGATVAFTMNAFTADMRRETRVCGSKGELRWDGSTSPMVSCAMIYICSVDSTVYTNDFRCCTTLIVAGEK